MGRARARALRAHVHPALASRATPARDTAHGTPRSGTLDLRAPTELRRRNSHAERRPADDRRSSPMWCPRPRSKTPVSPKNRADREPRGAPPARGPPRRLPDFSARICDCKSGRRKSHWQRDCLRAFWDLCTSSNHAFVFARSSAGFRSADGHVNGKSARRVLLSAVPERVCQCFARDVSKFGRAEALRPMAKCHGKWGYRARSAAIALCCRARFFLAMRFSLRQKQISRRQTNGTCSKQRRPRRVGRASATVDSRKCSSAKFTKPYCPIISKKRRRTSRWPRTTPLPN